MIHRHQNSRRFLILFSWFFSLFFVLRVEFTFFYLPSVPSPSFFPFPLSVFSFKIWRVATKKFFCFSFSCILHQHLLHFRSRASCQISILCHKISRCFTKQSIFSQKLKLLNVSFSIPSLHDSFIFWFLFFDWNKKSMKSGCKSCFKLIIFLSYFENFEFFWYFYNVLFVPPWRLRMLQKQNLQNMTLFHMCD